jgi:hypothetical protein
VHADWLQQGSRILDERFTSFDGDGAHGYWMPAVPVAGRGSGTSLSLDASGSNSGTSPTNRVLAAVSITGSVFVCGDRIERGRGYCRWIVIIVRKDSVVRRLISQRG